MCNTMEMRLDVLLLQTCDAFHTHQHLHALVMVNGDELVGQPQTSVSSTELKRASIQTLMVRICLSTSVRREGGNMKPGCRG